MCVLKICVNTTEESALKGDTKPRSKDDIQIQGIKQKTFYQC